MSEPTPRTKPAALLPPRAADPTAQQRRIQHIRQQLERGCYDEDAAMEKTLKSLADDLGVRLEGDA